MKCPHCGIEDFSTAIIPIHAQYNVEQYGGVQLVATLCCNKPINLRRIVKVDVQPITTTRTEDDWGVEFK